MKSSARRHHSIAYKCAWYLPRSRSGVSKRSQLRSRLSPILSALLGHKAVQQGSSCGNVPLGDSGCAIEMERAALNHAVPVDRGLDVISVVDVNLDETGRKSGGKFGSGRLVEQGGGCSTHADFFALVSVDRRSRCLIVE